MILKGLSGKSYQLAAKPFSDGAEGDIYSIPAMPGGAVKVYHADCITRELEQKLLVMYKHPPSREIFSQIAWPVDLVYDLNGAFQGFVMLRFNVTDGLNDIYAYPPKKNISYKAKVIIAQNICAVISEIHKAGFIFGDFNPKNIGIDLNTCHVAFFDTDSYHIVDGPRTYRCKVCWDGYVAPELLKKCEPYKTDAYARAPLPTFTRETDNFALAIHIFRLLMNGYTPFNGIREDESVSTASPGTGNQAIKRDNYCFKPGNKPQAVAVPPLSALPKEIADLFTRAFISGRIDPARRPTAVEWHKALLNYENSLVSCPNNNSHMYQRGLPSCPWCDADSRYTALIAGPAPQIPTQPPISQRTFPGAVVPMPQQSPPQSPSYPPPVAQPLPIVSSKDLVGIWTGDRVDSSGHIPYLYFSFPGHVYFISSRVGMPAPYEFTKNEYHIANSYSIYVDSAGQTVCDFGNYSAIIEDKHTFVAMGGAIGATYSNQAPPSPQPLKTVLQTPSGPAPGGGRPTAPPTRRASHVRKRRRKKRTPVILLLIAALIAVSYIAIGNYQRGQYNQAMALMTAGSYSEAADAFKELGSYSDAKEQFLNATYQEAMVLMTAGNYGEAAAVFEKLSGYSDSEERILEAKYQEAAALLEAGNRPAAAMAFGALGDYQDARVQSFALWDEIAVRETISAGNMHAVGVRSDGTVVAVGENVRGQCNVEAWTDIIAVSASVYHTVGLKADGTVVAVGENQHGQCDVEAWTDIVAISAGGNETVALRSDGTVVARCYDQKEQKAVEAWTDIVAISADTSYIVGLRADGTVVGAGKAANQDLGSWTDITAISASNWHVIGLKADGTVLAEGEPFYGELNVGEWKDITAISAGFSHTVGMKTDGSLVAVGSYGIHEPVESWTNIAAFSAGTAFTIGLKTNGTVVFEGRGRIDVSNWSGIKVPSR